MEIDPAIAAAMGFSGFGQTGKKRKYNGNDAFVDNQQMPGSTNTKAAATGSNQVEVAERTVKHANTQSAHSGDNAGADASATPAAQPEQGGEKSRLELLRHGIRNEQGDTAYFLSSFIEDPWKDCKVR